MRSEEPILELIKYGIAIIGGSFVGRRYAERKNRKRAV